VVETNQYCGISGEQQLKEQYAYPIEILQFAINSTKIQMTIMNTKQIVPCPICVDSTG